MLVTPAFGLIATVKSTLPAAAIEVLAAPNAVELALPEIVPPVTLIKIAELDAAALERTESVPVDRSVAV
jgi:hypothetical protein